MIPKTNAKILTRALLYSGVAIVTFFAIFPLVWIVLCAFKPIKELFSLQFKILPQSPTIQGFKNLFLMTDFLIYYKNSIIVSISATLLTITIGSLSAYSYARFTFRGDNILQSVAVLCYMLPPILLAIPLYIIMVKIGLIDKLSSLALSYMVFTLPFAFLYFSLFFRNSVSVSLEEAAMIDGATRLGAFFRITLPLALPAIIAIAIFAFLATWNDYTLAYILINNQEKFTLSIGLSTFMEVESAYYDLLLAGATLMVIPALILFIFIQKPLIKGLSAGAVNE